MIDKKDLNKLLWEFTNLGFFSFLVLSFVLWNITLLFFLFYRVFQSERYINFLKLIQTKEEFTFRKMIEIDPLSDDDDDWEPWVITEEFEEESLEVEEILKKLEKKQLDWANNRSNINRYIYWWMEASLLWYLLWSISTINWLLDLNIVNSLNYTLVTTWSSVLLFFIYNYIFRIIYWTESRFKLYLKNLTKFS